MEIRSEETNWKITTLEEVAFGFERSLVNTIGFTQLTSELDILNYLAFNVNQVNSTHIMFLLENPKVLTVVFILVLNNF